MLIYVGLGLEEFQLKNIKEIPSGKTQIQKIELTNMKGILWRVKSKHSTQKYETKKYTAQQKQEELKELVHSYEYHSMRVLQSLVSNNSATRCRWWGWFTVLSISLERFFKGLDLDDNVLKICVL